MAESPRSQPDVFLRRRLLVSFSANALHTTGHRLNASCCVATPRHGSAMTRCRVLPDTRNHPEFTFANLRYRTLARRPGKRATAEDMHMQMKYRLADVCAVVDHQAEGLTIALVGCDAACSEHEMAQ